MSSIKPLVLYGDNHTSPNPFKVVLILNELGLPYETRLVAFNEVKNPEYTAINPNGRLPTLYDPNQDLTLWESGAIIQYLVEEYDKDHKISFPKGSKEAYLANQWLHFQMSGQGPYYGQAVWFQKFHPETVPSAIERYQKETKRVTAVLDKFLVNKDYLVGNKASYADISFIPWQTNVSSLIVPGFDGEKEAPNVTGWLKRLHERPVIARWTEVKSKANAVASK